MFFVLMARSLAHPYRQARTAADLKPLNRQGDALPAADAHGHQTEPAADTLQLIHRLDGDDRARRAHRMAQRNRPTVRVHARWV